MLIRPEDRFRMRLGPGGGSGQGRGLVTANLDGSAREPPSELGGLRNQAARPPSRESADHGAALFFEESESRLPALGLCGAKQLVYSRL